MSTKIESLELEIVSNSKSAVSGLNALTQSLGKLRNATSGVSTSTNKMMASNNMASLSFMAMVSKIKMVVQALSRIVSTIKRYVDKSSDYIENVNLFTIAMGKYADAAKSYAESVGEIMGIDPGEWMRNQGVFQTLITGFGVAGDKAAIMSKNLTQLGYDLASFYNIETEGDKGSMGKLQSAIAGELEPLRRLGYDLSQAKLEATALELGIDKSVSSMTQAEKSMLRYHAIMTQVTTVHGDMARTLDAPANQMRILKAQFEMLARSIGNIFIPMVNKLLPYFIAVTKVLREIVSGIATLVGFEMPEVDYSGVESVSSVAEDTETAMDGATKAAKKLKSYMMGFDELNVINPNEGSDSDVTTSAFDIELPEYDFLGQATSDRIDGITSEIKEILEPLEKLIDKTVEWAKALDFEPMTKGFERVGSSVETALSIIGDLFDFVYEDVLMPITQWAIENGLPAVFEAVAKALDTVGKVARPILDGIKEIKPVLEPIVSWVGDVFVTVFEGLGDIFTKVGDVFEKKGGTIKDIVTGIGDVISGIWKFLKPLIDEIIPLLKNTFSTIGDMIVGVIEGFIKGFKGFVDFLAGVFTGDWERAWDGFVNIFSGTWDMIVSVFTGVWEIIKDVVIAAWEGIKGVFTPIVVWFNENVIQPIVNFFKGLWDAVSGFFVGLWEDIKNIWNSIPTWFDENVIQPVANFFKGLWGTVANFFKGLWEDVKSIWSKVATWFDKKVIQPIVNFFAPIVEWISTFFYGCWLIIQAVWVVVSKWFDDNVIQPVKTAFNTVCDAIGGFFSALWEDIKDIWNTVSNWFDTNVIQPVANFFKGLWENVSGFFSSLWEDIKFVWNAAPEWFNTKIIQPVVGFFKGVWTSVSGFFSSLWEDIKGVWGTVSTWFSDTIIEPVKKAFKTACDAIGGFFSNLWLGIRQGVARAMNWVIGGIESAINWIIDGINKLVGGFDKIVQWAADVLGKDWGGISLVQKVSFSRITVPTYAEGGFPESGQAFIARENGIPEMVGTIGKRTAVANNEQIVESVASGVAEANNEQNALLRQQNELLRALLEKDTGVYLDGRSLSNSVDKYKREHGRVLITGGAL